MKAVVIDIPGLRLDVTPNSRMHWAKKAQRVKRQRAVVTALLSRHARPAPPCDVTITRIGPRRMDDDNATAAAKAARDATAAWLGIDDGDPRVRWFVVQATGPFAARIEVRACDSEAQTEWRPDGAVAGRESVRGIGRGRDGR